MESQAKAPTNLQSTSSTIKHTPTCNVLQEIEKLQKEVDDLISKAPEDDPEFKVNLKKLLEIKKVLAKNVKTGTGVKIMEKMGLRKEKIKTNAHDDEEHEEASANCERPPPDLLNANLDESILFGVDRILSTYEFVKNLFDN